MFEQTQPRKVSTGLGAGILFFPYIGAWFLLRDGYSIRARVIGFGWMLFAIYVLVHSYQLSSLNGPQPARAQASNSGDVATDTPHRPVISMGIFNAIAPGYTTYASLAPLIGPGELQVSSDSDGIKTESYRWTNPDGSNMSLMFQNDVLVMKSQYGLQ